MPSPRERLSHLLELAAQGAGERVHLADEVADLLLDWPSAYPAAMRGTFEALLEKIVGEMAPASCSAIAQRFAGREEVPLALFNAFFFSAPGAMQEDILARNAALGPADGARIDSDTLLSAVRGSRDCAQTLAEIACVPQAIAQAMLADPTGRGLAVLARATGMARASFSAMAILAGPVRSVAENFAMLGVYDAIPENGARHLLAAWRTKAEQPAAQIAAA